MTVYKFPNIEKALAFLRTKGYVPERVEASCVCYDCFPIKNLRGANYPINPHTRKPESLCHIQIFCGDANITFDNEYNPEFKEYHNRLKEIIERELGYISKPSSSQKLVKKISRVGSRDHLRL
jgi:hypothetical protein